MTTLSDKAAYLRELENKVKALQFLGMNLEGSKVTIEITFDCGSKCLIEQRLVPFNLSMEMRVLIGDSIDYWQRQITNLKKLPDEII
jgi:hypothetical protein